MSKLTRRKFFRYLLPTSLLAIFTKSSAMTVGKDTTSAQGSSLDNHDTTPTALRPAPINAGGERTAEMIPLRQGGMINDAITEITPEMFGAIGNGIKNDTLGLQSALLYWSKNSNYSFRADGIYLISSPLVIISPKMGSKCYINTIVQSSIWRDLSTSLFERTGSLIVLSMGNESSQSMWGSEIKIGRLQGASVKRVSERSVHGIRNQGWQQCEVEVGFSSNLISVINIVNTEQTTPTVRYKLRMARGNLMNFYAPTYIKNMYEGCIFETMWSSGGLFGCELLGQGSTYARIRGGSADFSGQHLTFISVNSTPSKIVSGQEVKNEVGTLLGWTIGLYYQKTSAKTYIIIAGENDVSDHTGSANSSNIQKDSVIFINKEKYNVISVFGPNSSHTRNRFLPTAICIAPVSQTIVRWKIERDYDSGVCFPSDIYWADSRVDTSNEAVRISTPLPSAASFTSAISSGLLVLSGARFATRLQVNNLNINSAGGFSTANHASVWKNTGKDTVLVRDGKKTTIAFTLKDLGGREINGRIYGRKTDPATDSIGLWELSGFGINSDGTFALDKWTVYWQDKKGFNILKTYSGTSFELNSSIDSHGSPILTLIGGMIEKQAKIESAWQYRITAMRTFML